MNRIASLLLMPIFLLAVAAALAQEDLPDDVRRALPATSTKIKEESPTTPVAASDGESVDEQLSKALLRYRNMSNNSPDLTQRWQAELDERLGRLEALLKSLEEKQPQPTSQKQPSTKPKMHTARRPVSPDTTARRETTSSAGSVTTPEEPIVVPLSPEPKRSDPESKESPNSTAANRTTKSLPEDSENDPQVQADELETLATACELLADTLRKAAKAMRLR